ncbi:MAG: BolA/IbaG family iron-sulfur metabolism protein [Pseudomonadota bacterium]
MLDAKRVEDLLEGTLREADADAVISVDGAGANYNITVVSDVFTDQRPVKRQQTVYAALREAIAEGTIHAVNIHTFTPDEWSARDA